MKKTFFILSICLAFSAMAQSGEFEDIEKAWKKLLAADHPKEIAAMDKSFYGRITNVIFGEDEVDLSSLEYFSDLRSSDSTFRVISYFIPLENGEYILRGVMCKAFPPQENGHLYATIGGFRDGAINDYSKDSVYSFSGNNSPRAWYYDMIETEDRFGETHYTLIGWTPLSRLVHRKVVEPVSFDDDPRLPRIDLGKPIFEVDGERPYRLIYDYSAQTTMKLSYDPEQDWIIMDHLSPSSPQYEGIPEYYGPDFSFDAFQWENGQWIYHPDVNVDQGLKKSKKDFEKEDKILEQDRMYDSN